MYPKQKVPMKHEEYLLASVLHDIGVLWKATGSTEPHSELGAAFVKKYFTNYDAAAEAIRNHHQARGCRTTGSLEETTIVLAALSPRRWCSGGFILEEAGRPKKNPYNEAIQSADEGGFETTGFATQFNNAHAKYEFPQGCAVKPLKDSKV